MAHVQALRPFKSNGEKRAPGEKFDTSDRHAADLARQGLVRLLLESVPVKKTPATGAAPPSFALPAAPVLPLETSSTSAGGEKPKRKRKSRAKGAAVS